MCYFCTPKEKAMAVGVMIPIGFEPRLVVLLMESYCFAREMAGMHFTYGRAKGNSREARRLYTEHYSQRRITLHKKFTKLRQRLSESRSFTPYPHTYCIVNLVSGQMQNSPILQ